MSLMRDSRRQYLGWHDDERHHPYRPRSADTTTKFPTRSRLTMIEALSANGIMTMYEDRGGLVWVGTFGGGISRYNPANVRKFEHFQSDPNDPDSISSNRITSFAEDANGNMWIGTDAGGLNLFDRKRPGVSPVCT